MSSLITFARKRSLADGKGPAAAEVWGMGRQ